MDINTYNGNEQLENIFLTTAFEPQALKISKENDVYAFTSDILGKEFKNIKEVKKQIKNSGVTKSAIILNEILLKILYRKNGDKESPFVIMKESYHMNRVYNDSYDSHLSGKHIPLKRWCKRLFFLDCPKYSNSLFDENESDLSKMLIGTCVIRPSLETEDIIGQTLLNPKRFEELQSEYICTAPYDVTMFGKRLHIEAFPYMMQDGEVITCAETTLIHLLDYFSRKYTSYRSVVPSDLFQIEKELSFERIIPSKGMTYKSVSHVLTKLNFHPKLYGFANHDIIKDKRIIHHYIDSAIPVAVSLNSAETKESHSVVAIGISNDNVSLSDSTMEPTLFRDTYFLDIADLCKGYVIMSDSSAPYSKMEIKTNKKESSSIPGFKIENDNKIFSLSSIIAPLEKRMCLDDYDASQIALSIASNRFLGIKEAILLTELGQFDGVGEKENPIIYRMLLVRAGSFRRKRSYGLDKNSLRWKVYSGIPLPKFVWVCELYSRESLERGNAIGEIVIDASASEMDGVSSAIIINYPYRLAYRTPDEPFRTFIDRYSAKEQPDDWQEIQPYVHFMEPGMNIK